MKASKGIISATVSFILMFCGCVTDRDEPEWSLQPGARLPDFEVTLNNGDHVTTESLKGKGGIIVFFSTACSDCRRELPEIQRYYEECLSQNRQEVFMCISREEGWESIESYWRDNGFTMPYSAQTDRRIYNLFATSGIPRVYEVNQELVITRAY